MQNKKISDQEGMKVCTGHICYMKKNLWFAADVRFEIETRKMLSHFAQTQYGCLTYGEGYDQRRLRLGTHQLNNYNYFLCAEKMCNMRSVSILCLPVVLPFLAQ